MLSINEQAPSSAGVPDVGSSCTYVAAARRKRLASGVDHISPSLEVFPDRKTSWDREVCRRLVGKHSFIPRNRLLGIQFCESGSMEIPKPPRGGAGNRSCEGWHARPTVELRAGTVAPSRPARGRKPWATVASASCQWACLGGGASSAWALLVFPSVQPRELGLGFPLIQPVQQQCSEDVRELQQQESPLDRGCSWTPPTYSSLGPPLGTRSKSSLFGERSP